MIRWLSLLPLIPLIESTIAAILLAIAGGFGGGHGRFDEAIAILGMPSILLVEQLAPRFVLANDVLLVVLWPALCNALLFSVPALTAFVIARLRRTA